jgi:succinate dehydrogenase hydrophobic anchor subunit
MSTDLNFRNAYLVLAHEDVDMLNLLVKRLINTGYVYIHIDLKSRIKVEQVHKHPKVRVTKQIKVNWAITVLAVASLAIHISVGLRTYVYKYFANKADKQAMVTGLSVADNRTKQVNNQTLVSLTANILIIAAMHVLAVSTIYVNNREPDFIEQFPNYILVYVQNLCIYPLLFLIIAFVYYVKIHNSEFHSDENSKQKFFI